MTTTVRPPVSKASIHWSVRAFDADLADSVFVEQVDQAAQAGIAVLDGLAQDLFPASVNDSHGMIVASPIDPSGPAVGRLVGQRIWDTSRQPPRCSTQWGGTRLSVPERDSRFAH